RLDLGCHPVADEAIDDLEDDVAHAEDERPARRRSDELRHELTRVTEKEAAHRTVHAVPSFTEAPVGEEAHGEHAPYAAHAVNRDGPDGIVDAQPPFDVANREGHEQSGDDADES